VKKRNVNRLFAFWAALLCAALVSANEAKPAADDPALERRVMNLSVELRCLVCQNQTIADSSAPLAVDLRNQIRDQLKRGATEREVTEFMVARYGDFVLYRPPFKATTLFLWLGPFVLLALGLFVLIRRIRARRALAEPALSDAERVRAARLLDSAPE
jgi:cytochrome c-type biogenesis protein CcmH